VLKAVGAKRAVMGIIFLAGLWLNKVRCIVIRGFSEFSFYLRGTDYINAVSAALPLYSESNTPYRSVTTERNSLSVGQHLFNFIFFCYLHNALFVGYVLDGASIDCFFQNTGSADIYFTEITGFGQCERI
jgi:hypothetical protein